jgi:hypothetical protein
MENYLYLIGKEKLLFKKEKNTPLLEIPFFFRKGNMYLFLKY